MTTRKTLRSTNLTGARATIRTTSFYAIAAAAAIGAVGYVLPAHRLPNDADFHSNYADGGPLPLLVFAIVAIAALLLRKLRLGGGMIAGALGVAGLFGAIAPILLTHMFSRPEHAYGEHVFTIGVLGMFFLGAALLIAEPILYVLERRSIERAALPAPLPLAVATRA